MKSSTSVIIGAVLVVTFVALILFLKEESNAWMGFYYTNADQHNDLRALIMRPDYKSLQLKSIEECRSWAVEIRKRRVGQPGAKTEMFVCVQGCRKDIWTGGIACNFETSEINQFDEPKL